MNRINYLQFKIQKMKNELQAGTAADSSTAAQETPSSQPCTKPHVSGSLPSVDEAGAMAVKISEMVEPKMNAQGQAMFIAGFCECVKWLSGNDR